MSPDLAFLLTLALRMAVAAAFVVAASIITERSGPVIGALFATLPISAGPSFVFLALDHDAAFVSQGALAGLPVNAITIFFGLTYVVLAQRHGIATSVTAALAVWLTLTVASRLVPWTLASAILFNVVTFAICLPLVQRYRTARMPLIARRWYDMPLRAVLVASLVATVVTLSSHVGPAMSGVIALFPVVFFCLMLLLHRRIGGTATAALIANGLWGLVGFCLAIVILHLATARFGSPIGLSLALATGVTWNLGLWWYGRRGRATLRSS